MSVHNRRTCCYGEQTASLFSQTKRRYKGRTSVEEIIQILVSQKSPRGKRQLAAIFLELPDRTEYPQYYEVIPEPRCINNIRASVEKNRYRDAMDAYTDLSLVFWNALYYNEETSQIASDAETLKNILETEWKKRSVLPIPRSSPPPSAPQKVHPPVEEPESESETKTSTRETTEAPPASTPARVSTPSVAPPPEIDVETHEMTPEVEATWSDDASGAKDEEGEEIVRQLEKSLPKWEGYGEGGWMTEGSSEMYQALVHAIKSHKDVVGNRLASALEVVPEELPMPILSSTGPLSLKIIENRARNNHYKAPKEFDLDMMRLFEKARRFHQPTAESSGRVLLLQRLYQALTSSSPPPGPPYMSATNFASVRAGPGHAKPLSTAFQDPDAAGVTTFRVSSKDRTFVDEVWYKGWSIRLADWLHLSNPDDPSRPIVAQVFKVWLSDEPSKKGQPGITACWYFRPEQTFHPSHRQFWKGEVFKTSYFADHPLEDLLEKIACQFTARHIRGRPRPPYWYPGWPLYMCDSRYNDRERMFVRIKNWNSCVPEEVRKSDEFMPIYLFERTVFPRKGPSPFLGKGAVKGPGGIDENVGKEDGDKEKEKDAGGAAGSRKRSSRRMTTMDPTIKQTTGNVSSAMTPPQYPYQSYTQPQQSYPLQNRSHTDSIDRTAITAAGGLAALGNNAFVEKLSPEITKHFDRDPETNEVLWFSAPPMNVARPPTARHSLAYLHFLASKRRRGSSENDDQDDAMDIDSQQHPKRAMTSKSMTETLRDLAVELARQNP